MDPSEALVAPDPPTATTVEQAALEQRVRQFYEQFAQLAPEVRTYMLSSLNPPFSHRLEANDSTTCRIAASFSTISTTAVSQHSDGQLTSLPHEICLHYLMGRSSKLTWRCGVMP